MDVRFVLPSDMTKEELAKIHEETGKDFAYREVTLDAQGKEVYRDVVLPLTKMLNQGILAVQAQDAALAEMYSEMEKQTQTLNDVNELLQLLNAHKSALQDQVGSNTRAVLMTADERAKIQQTVDLYNTYSGKEKVTLTNPVEVQKLGELYDAVGAFSGPMLKAALEKVTPKMSAEEVTAAVSAYSAGHSATSAAINTTKANMLSPEAQKMLTNLADNHGLQLGGFNADSSLSITQIETLQANLGTIQSSQGALNEDLSLKLNQAASSRAAIFTQLQTMLQTIMQTRAQLARF